jgi:hypothetical protein
MHGDCVFVHINSLPTLLREDADAQSPSVGRDAAALGRDEETGEPRRPEKSGYHLFATQERKGISKMDFGMQRCFMFSFCFVLCEPVPRFLVSLYSCPSGQLGRSLRILLRFTWIAPCLNCTRSPDAEGGCGAVAGAG